MMILNLATYSLFFTPSFRPPLFPFNIFFPFNKYLFNRYVCRISKQKRMCVIFISLLYRSLIFYLFLTSYCFVPHTSEIPWNDRIVCRTRIALEIKSRVNLLQSILEIAYIGLANQ